MKRDGTLTKAEQTTLRKAFYILDEWWQAHRLDDDATTCDAIAEVVTILNEHLPRVLREASE